MCEHSNKDYRAVLSFEAVFEAAQGGSKFSKSVSEALKCDEARNIYYMI